MLKALLELEPDPVGTVFGRAGDGGAQSGGQLGGPDLAATDAGDQALDEGGPALVLEVLVEGRLEVGAERAFVAVGERLFDDDDAARVPAGLRPGPGRGTAGRGGRPARPRLMPLVPQHLDHVAQLVGQRTEADHDVLGVVAAVGLEEGVSAPPEDLLELVLGLLGDRQGASQVFLEQVADLHVAVGHLAGDVHAHVGQRDGVEVGRILRIEGVGRLEGLQEARDLLLLRHLEGHVGVGEQVAVVADHHRDADCFGDGRRP